MPALAQERQTRSIDLHFTQETPAVLDRVVYQSETRAFSTCRGDLLDRSFGPDGQFRWTAAVKALSILLIEHAMSSYDGSSIRKARLTGNHGTEAASLSNAISARNKNRWLVEMFGVSIFRKCNSSEKRPPDDIDHLFQRRNPNLTSSSTPVDVWINESKLPAINVRIYCGDSRVDSVSQLENLWNDLRSQWTPHHAGGRRSKERLGTIGVFGVAIRHFGNTAKFLVNVRRDQPRQRKFAGLPDDTDIEIVDLPGGRFRQCDGTEEDALIREFKEETTCCVDIKFETRVGPFRKKTSRTKPAFDYAYAWEVDLADDATPMPTNEASRHEWISWEELTARDSKLRLPGAPGNDGRMGKMLREILDNALIEQKHVSRRNRIPR